MTIAIIGAGMAGLACADALVERGLAVRLFDKGRGPGGRMSTRRMEIATQKEGSRTVAFDHGAQYVTARDPAFVAQMQRWEASGAAARWPAAGADVWVGTPGMSALVNAMAERHAVRWGCRVERIERAADGWRLVGDGLDEDGFDAVVIAVPAEQVAALADPHAPEIAAAARASHSEPCWTVMAAFDAPLPAADILRAGDGLPDGSPLGWATRNSAKPGRDADVEAWVIQATPGWSAAHLEEERDPITPALLTALSQALGTPLPTPTIATAHRWRYARADASIAPADRCLWEAELGLGACGDWLSGPRIEAAWLSGQALANALLSGCGTNCDQLNIESRGAQTGAEDNKLPAAPPTAPSTIVLNDLPAAVTIVGSGWSNNCASIVAICASALRRCASLRFKSSTFVL